MGEHGQVAHVRRQHIIMPSEHYYELYKAHPASDEWQNLGIGHDDTKAGYFNANFSGNAELQIMSASALTPPK